MFKKKMFAEISTCISTFPLHIFLLFPWIPKIHFCIVLSVVCYNDSPVIIYGICSPVVAKYVNFTTCEYNNLNES